MTPGDPIHILLAHDHWATQSLLTACEGLSHDHLNQRFEIGCGSIHDNVVHMIGAMQIWSDTLAQRTPRPWIDEKPRRTVSELKSMVTQAAADLQACALTGPLDQLLTRERLGQVYTYSRATIITHVTTHGMHHRAQCLNMLRHLGISPLPQSSVVEWSRAGCPGLHET